MVRKWSKFFLYNSISRCRMRSWCYYRSSSQNDAAKTLLCAKNNCLGDIYDWWFDLKDFLYHHQFTVFDNIFKLAFDALLLYNHWRSLNLNGTIVIKIQWQKLASILFRISPGKKRNSELSLQLLQIFFNCITQLINRHGCHVFSIALLYSAITNYTVPSPILRGRLCAGYKVTNKAAAIWYY